MELNPPKYPFMYWDIAQDSELDEKLGRVLAFYRWRQGLTQAEAAKRLGVAQSLIAKVEKGKRRLLFRDVLGFASCYNFSLAELSNTLESDGMRQTIDKVDELLAGFAGYDITDDRARPSDKELMARAITRRRAASFRRPSAKRGG